MFGYSKIFPQPTHGFNDWSLVSGYFGFGIK